jgi:hypothetical protein
LNYANLTPNDRSSIYGFVYSLPEYGTQIEEGGMAWFLESVADLTTLGGQAIVACLRQGQNQVALDTAGVGSDIKIPSNTVPPPPAATLIPSTYSETEAKNLVIK